jgi:hypothetical protein
MKHIKPYHIFESQSPSDYSIVGIYDDTDKDEALSKLREIGMNDQALNLLALWGNYVTPFDKFIILRHQTGRHITLIFPPNLKKDINPKFYAIDSNNQYIKDPEEVKKILQVIPHLNSEEDIISRIKANPMDQDLLDKFPEGIRTGIIQRSGMKDVSALARSMRRGLV